MAAASGRPLTIGVDASRAVHRQAAGVGHYSRHLIAALLADGRHRYRLYANDAAAPPWAQAPAAEWRNLPCRRAWTYLRLAPELALHPPDALLVPAHVVPPGGPRATVVTIHDLGYLRYPECHPPRQRLYLRLSTLWNARAARVILADSAATRYDLVRLLRVPPGKVVVAYPGVSEEFGPRPAAAIEAIRERYALPERFLLFVGTIQPRKNIARLLRAHAAVPEAPPLVLAGGQGWLSDRLVAETDAAGPRVRRLGYVPDDDLPPLMAAATALLLPSLYEGFGIPVLEAMACGTPVLASNTSSLPEVVGDCGTLVDPLSVPAIAEGIASLLADPDRTAAMALRGRERAAGFTWAACARTALAAVETARTEG